MATILVRTVQRALRSRGYNLGPAGIDGRWGYHTRSALDRFTAAYDGPMIDWSYTAPGRGATSVRFRSSAAVRHLERLALAVSVPVGSADEVVPGVPAPPGVEPVAVEQPPIQITVSPDGSMTATAPESSTGSTTVRRRATAKPKAMPTWAWFAVAAGVIALAGGGWYLYQRAA